MPYTKNSHLGWVEEPSLFLLESDHPIGVTCSLNSLNMENEMAMVQLLKFFLPQLDFIVVPCSLEFTQHHVLLSSLLS